MSTSLIRPLLRVLTLSIAETQALRLLLIEEGVLSQEAVNDCRMRTYKSLQPMLDRLNSANDEELYGMVREFDQAI